MGTEIPGIDISKHNGAINWQQVAAAGKKFAIIRVGWAGYDGRIAANGGLDSLFHTNVQGALAAGIDVGVYVYAYCKTVAAAKIAAQETLGLIAPYKLTYPVVFDMETDGTPYAGYTKAQNTEIARAFLDAIQDARYYAMLYTFKSFALSSLNMSELAAYDLWLAHVGANGTALSKTDYTGAYGIWQYSWTGKVSGIPNNVDLNWAYKDYPAIIRAAGLNGLGEDAEPDAPEAEVADSDLAERYSALQAQLTQTQENADAMEREYWRLKDKHDAMVTSIKALVDKSA